MWQEKHLIRIRSRGLSSTSAFWLLSRVCHLASDSFGFQFYKMRITAPVTSWGYCKNLILLKGVKVLCKSAVGYIRCN